MTQGIYQIKNLKTNKIYIGQSKNIEYRWKQHQNNFLSHLDGSPLLYQAFIKEGIENFSFSILEEVKDEKLLNEREEFYILKNNTLSPNGYNCILPTDSLRGEHNIKNKISKQEVDEIKNLLKNSKLTIKEIANKYNLSLSNIYRINRGEIWNDFTQLYPIRFENQLARKGSKNGHSLFTEDEVYNIRKQYVYKSVDELYEEYKDKCSYSGFKKIVQGTTYKNVPIYKKKLKIWI